jgi:hypothetical protein
MATEHLTSPAFANRVVLTRGNGVRAGFAFAVSRDFTIQEVDFQLPAAGSVLLKIEGRIGAASDRFARLSMTAAATQARAADGGVLVQVPPTWPTPSTTGSPETSTARTT